VAAGAAIASTGQSPSGTYARMDVTSGDSFVAPAPAGPYGDPAPVGSATLNGTFASQNPNGTWSLYVVDDAGGDVGSIASWCLELTTSLTTPTSTNTATPTNTATATGTATNTATATNTNT